MRRHFVAATVTALVVGAVSCGSPPSGPSPQPTPTPTPPNAPPVVEGITASVARVDVDGTVTITATVRDAETPVGQLQYTWQAEAGTFEGQGASVTWRAPRTVSAPTNYAISLTVTEAYGAGRQNVVPANGPTIRVHDSPREIAELGRTFLEKFGDSRISAAMCVIDFSDAMCRDGKDKEFDDIDSNRKNFEILEYTLGQARVSYVPGRSNGDVTIRSTFRSRIYSCRDWPPEDGPCALNTIETATFDGFMTVVYHESRWWLCTSEARPIGRVSPAMRRFFGSTRR